MTAQQRQAVLLQAVVVVGLIALAIRFYVTTADLSRPGYDGLFDGLFALFVAGLILGLAGLVVVATVGLRFGLYLGILWLDVAVAILTIGYVALRVLASHHVTPGRWLGMAVGGLALVGAFLVRRAWRGRWRGPVMPTERGPMW